MPTVLVPAASVDNTADGETKTQLVPFQLYVCTPLAYTCASSVTPAGTCRFPQEPRFTSFSGATAESPPHAMKRDATATAASECRSAFIVLLFMSDSSSAGRAHVPPVICCSVTC